jgi:hypothetical protein
MKKSAVEKSGVMWVTVKKDVRNWSESLNNDVRVEMIPIIANR